MDKPKLKLPAGVGVYETLAVVGRRPAFLGRHLDRIVRGAELLGIPKARERVDAAIRSKLAFCTEEPTALRVDAQFHGIPGTSLRPRKQLPDGPIVLYWPKAGKARSADDTLKHTFRGPKVAARNEATAAGAWEALVLNDKGIAVEGTVTNLFAVLDGKLVTPGDDLFPLAGIARAIVLEEAARLDIPVELRGLGADDAARASELFVTNALIGVVPVDVLLFAEGRRVELPAARGVALRLEEARRAREEEDLKTAPGPITYGEN